MLSRCVVIVKAREPFLLWLQPLHESASITLDQVNEDTTGSPECGCFQERKGQTFILRISSFHEHASRSH